MNATESAKHNKAAIRKRLIATRQQMTAKETELLSRRIVNRAITLVNWDTVQSAHIYQPLQTYREVDTAPLIAYLQEKYPNVTIATWHKINGEYQAYWLANNQPAPSDQQFDVIIVPVLGFNTYCHRIGFGGGFYDRYLATRQTALTIGLCYEAGMVNFPSETHDIPLNHIVMESGCITPERLASQVLQATS